MLKMQIWYEFQKLGERCVQTWEPFSFLFVSFLFLFMGSFLPNIDYLKKKKSQVFCCKFSFIKWKNCKTFCLQKLLFEEGLATVVLSAGYRFNGPLQTCCQLRRNLFSDTPHCASQNWGKKPHPKKTEKKTGSEDMKNPSFSCPLPSHISYMP